jgi:sporulation protein YlmC with PRC-barrel domain
MHVVTEYAIGDEVGCIDGPCGTLTRVIVNPVNRTLTHLVVEPGRHGDEARLVPVDLVRAGAAPGEGIALLCDKAAFDALEYAQESEFLPAEEGELGYSAGQMRFMPYFPLGGGMGSGAMAGTGGLLGGHEPPEPRVVSHDRVPAGEVQIRRGQHVHAADGDIGRVQGLVIDPSDDRVTHVLLQEGHLWGKKDVAIPVDAVSSVRDGIHLNLSKDDVRDLPEIEIGRR